MQAGLASFGRQLRFAKHGLSIVQSPSSSLRDRVGVDVGTIVKPLVSAPTLGDVVFPAPLSPATISKRGGEAGPAGMRTCWSVELAYLRDDGDRLVRPCSSLRLDGKVVAGSSQSHARVASFATGSRRVSRSVAREEVSPADSDVVPRVDDEHGVLTVP